MALRSMTSPIFRLATINVHGFQNARFQNNLNELISILKPLNLDLLAVEEVDKTNGWQKFCQELGLNYFQFETSYNRYCGNGLASKYSIQSTSSQQASVSCSGGQRSILQCRFNDEHPFLQNHLFAVTHLDHLNEDHRLKQIKQFRPNDKQIDVLLGDFNALTRDDYSDKYYQNIVEGKRRQSGWELPRFDLTNLLTNEWKYEDVFRIANPELKDEDVVTCEYGTRIDYIYIQRKVLQKWNLTKCEIIDTKGATDHNAVLAEFQLK